MQFGFAAITWRDVTMTAVDLTAVVLLCKHLLPDPSVLARSRGEDTQA